MVPKKIPGGTRTPRGLSKATPNKVNTTEEDEDNLEFEDDSDDESFRLELDEESLDEEMDEEDLDEADEDSAPSPTTKREQAATKLKQGLPKTQTPRKTQTPTKRKAEEGPEAPAKRVRLEDYIPASQVFDYAESDRYIVRLSNLDRSLVFKDVDNACTDAISIIQRKRASSRFVLARYRTEEAAQAALKKLQTMKLKGTPFTVALCDNFGNCAHLISNCVLEVHNVPQGTGRKEFRDLFPGSQLLIFRAEKRYAKLLFQSQDDLKNAIKDPRCHAIGEAKLEFAYGIRKPKLGKKEKKPQTSKSASVSPAAQGTPSSPGGEKDAPTTAAGKRKRQRASKSVSASPAAEGTPSTPAAKGAPSTPGGEKEAPTTAAGKRKRQLARKSVSASPAAEGTPSTPRGEKEAPTTTPGKKKIRKPRASKKASASPAAEGTPLAPAANGAPSTPGAEKEAPATTPGKKKIRKSQASKSASACPAAEATPSTPRDDKEAPTATSGKRKRKQQASRSPSASSAANGTLSTPGGKKRKNPEKRALVVKTPLAKTPKSFKVVGTGKTPLPKQTHKETPKGAINEWK